MFRRTSTIPSLFQKTSERTCFGESDSNHCTSVCNSLQLVLFHSLIELVAHVENLRRYVFYMLLVRSRRLNALGGIEVVTHV